MPTLSGIPRLESANVPLNKVTKSSITVSAVVDISDRFMGGIIFCGVSSLHSSSPAIPKIIRRPEDIKWQSHFTTLDIDDDKVLTGSLAVNILINNLTPMTIYDVFCFAEDSFGLSGRFEKNAIATNIKTHCCHDVYFAGNFPIYILDDMLKYFEMSQRIREESYAVGFEISALPTSSVIVSLGVTGNNSVVTISPQGITFTNNSIEKYGYFLVSANDGSFAVFLTINGESSDEFSTTGVTDIPLTVINDAVGPPPPQLLSAFFNVDGSGLTVSFNSPTDFAPGAVSNPFHTWHCDTVLSFMGDDEAGCLWLDSSRIRITLHYYALNATTLLFPQIGDAISLLPGIIRAYCSSSSCDTFQFSNASTVTIATNPEEDFVVALPFLSQIGHSTSCSDLIIDASGSQNSGGRPWTTVDWRVSLVNEGIKDTNATASVGRILSHLSALDASDLNKPIVIPSSLLEQTEYFISLGLRNFMQSPTDPLLYASTKVSVLPGDELIFSLNTAGAADYIVERSSANNVDLSVQAEISSCSAETADAARDNASLTFVWEVFDSDDMLLNGSDILSSSNDPSSFVLNSMVLDIGSYEVHVTANARFSEESGLVPQTSTSVFDVHITAAALMVGKINGVSAKVVNAGAAFSLDTREAIDPSRRPHEAQDLHWEWSCKVVSSQDFGTNCFETWGFMDSPLLQESVLDVPIGKTFGGYVYEISVRMSSNDYGVYRSAIATINIETSSNAIQDFHGGYDPVELALSSSKLNTNSKIIIQSSISCSNLVGPVSAVWSLTSTRSLADLAVENMTVSVVSREFSIAQVTKAVGINFPIAFHRDALSPGETYSLRLSLTTASPGNGVAKTSFAEVTLTCNEPPRGGVLEVIPATGVSFETEFTMTASYWSDDAEDFPLRYHFKYQSLASYDGDLPTQKASTLGTAPFTVTSLPAGKDVDNNVLTAIVDVFDVWDGRATTSVAVEVVSMFASGRRRMATLPSSVEDLIIEELLPTAISRLSSHLDLSDLNSFQKDMQKTLNYFALLTEADCSFSPNCASLNRASCSSTSHTCGKCLDGFSGVYGDSNTLCTDASSSSVVAVGSHCSSDEECDLGTCNASVCISPTKSCPIGRTSGEVCSGIGQGLCTFVNYQGEPLTEEKCTVDNTFCQAMCSCQFGYVGSDCSISVGDDTRVPRDILRRDVCSNLYEFSTLLDPTPSNLETYADYIADILYMDEVITVVTLDKCGQALGGLGKLLNTSSLLSKSPSSTGQRIIDMLSNLVESDNSPQLEDVIFTVLDDFGHSWQYDIIEGEEGVGIASDNLKLSYFYPILTDLPNKVLTAAQTPTEQYYNSETFSMTLSNENEFASCSNFGDYAMFVAVLWGYSPVAAIRSERSLQTAQFTILPVATADFDESQLMHDVSYSLELLLYEFASYDNASPACYEMDVNTGSVIACESCNVSSYTASSVSLSCVEASEVLCPVQANMVVSLFTASRAAVSDKIHGFGTRSLQSFTQPSKYYTIRIMGEDELDTLTAGASVNVETATGMISFMCVLLALMLFGFIALRKWDESDRKGFILKRQILTEKGLCKFDISAAFDESGKGIMDIHKNIDDPCVRPRNLELEVSLDDSDDSSEGRLSRVESSDSFSRSTFGLTCASDENIPVYHGSPVRNPFMKKKSFSENSFKSFGDGGSMSESSTIESSTVHSGGRVATRHSKDSGSDNPSSSRESFRSLGRVFQSPSKSVESYRKVKRQKSRDEESLSALISLGSSSKGNITVDISEPFFDVEFSDEEQNCVSTVVSESIFSRGTSFAADMPTSECSSTEENSCDQSEKDEVQNFSRQNSYEICGASLGDFCICEAHSCDTKEIVTANSFSSYPPTSLLSELPLTTRIWQALSRHHRIFRIFTYPSLRKARVIRFAVAVNDVIWLTFACAVMYSLLYPSDDVCSKILVEGDCASTSQTFVSDSLPCVWDSTEGCLAGSSPPTVTTAMVIVCLCIALSVLPRQVVQAILENVCSRRPCLEDCGMNSGAILGELPESWESAAQRHGRGMYDSTIISTFLAKTEGNKSFHNASNSVEWLAEPNASAFDGGDVFKYNSWSTLTKPYCLGHCDSITTVDELDLLTSASSNYFRNALHRMPFPWLEKLYVLKGSDLNEPLDYYDISEMKGPETLVSTAMSSSVESCLTDDSLDCGNVNAFGRMVAIMNHLGVNADSTPEMLTWYGGIRHGNAYNALYTRIENARSESKNIQFEVTSPCKFSPGQTDYMDTILLQNFILELLPSQYVISLRNKLFDVDHASPGSCSLFLWVICWTFVVVSWFLMSAFILNWAIVEGNGPMASVATVLSLIIFVDYGLCEISVIMLLHVYVMGHLRPLLRDIYEVLCAAYVVKLRNGYEPVKHIRVVQHLSASCRASRLRSLSYLASAGLLSLLEDRDILRCCRRCSADTVGFFARATLLVPSLFNWTQVEVQMGLLTLLLLSLWCGMILLQAFLVETSIVAVLIFWAFLFLAVLAYSLATRHINQRSRHEKTAVSRLPENSDHRWKMKFDELSEETDGELHKAPVAFDGQSFCDLCTFQIRRVFCLQQHYAQEVDETWRIFNAPRFKNFEGILRSSLFKPGPVNVDHSLPSSVIVPAEVSRMMVVSSTAWHADQRWRFLQCLQKIPLVAWNAVNAMWFSTPNVSTACARVPAIKSSRPPCLQEDDDSITSNNLELLMEQEASNKVNDLLATEKYYDESENIKPMLSDSYDCDDDVQVWQSLNKSQKCALALRINDSSTTSDICGEINTHDDSATISHSCKSETSNVSGKLGTKRGKLDTTFVPRRFSDDSSNGCDESRGGSGHNKSSMSNAHSDDILEVVANRKRYRGDYSSASYNSNDSSGMSRESTISRERGLHSVGQSEDIFSAVKNGMGSSSGRSSTSRRDSSDSHKQGLVRDNSCSLDSRRTRSSWGSSGSDRRRRNHRSDSVAEETNQLYDQDHAFKVNKSAEKSSTYVPLNVVTHKIERPIPQHGLIHAAFVAQSRLDENGNHCLPMSSLVEFATMVLQSPDMLRSSKSSEPIFEIAEIHEAVEPLVIFSSSPDQAQLSVEFKTFTNWLDKSCEEIMDKRQHANELLVERTRNNCGNVNTESEQRLHKNSAKETEQSLKVKSKPAHKHDAESRSGTEHKMVGMVLTFQDDDEISALTNPMSTMGNRVKNARTKQSNDSNVTNNSNFKSQFDVNSPRSQLSRQDQDGQSSSHVMGLNHQMTVVEEASREDSEESRLSVKNDPIQEIKSNERGDQSGNNQMKRTVSWSGATDIQAGLSRQRLLVDSSDDEDSVAELYATAINSKFSPADRRQNLIAMLRDDDEDYDDDDGLEFNTRRLSSRSGDSIDANMHNFTSESDNLSEESDDTSWVDYGGERRKPLRRKESTQSCSRSFLFI